MGEMLLLVVVGLFVFGPERLPGIARDAARMIRQFRDQARSMRDDLTAELGPELADLDLKSLHPKTFVEKHLLGDDEDERPARTPASSQASASSAASSSPAAGSEVASEIPLTKQPRPPRPVAQPDRTPYDDDAT